MRLIYFALVEFDVPGGPAAHTLNLLKGFQALGIETLFVGPKPKDGFAKNFPARARGVPFFSFDLFYLLLFDLASFFILLWELILFRPDYLYVREREGNLWPGLAALLTFTPYFVENNGPFFMDYLAMNKMEMTGSGLWTEPLFRPLILAVRKIWRGLQFLLARGMTYNTAYWHDALNREFKIAASRAVVATMYVDTALFKPMPREDSRKKLKIASGRLVMGYVGSFQPSHEMELMFAALEKLCAQGHDAELVLAGGGNLYDYYKQRIEAFPLGASRTRFLGWVRHEEIPQIMNACDVGLSLLKEVKNYQGEALTKNKEFIACGVPIIVSSPPGLFEGYPQGSVYFLGEHSAQALAALILKVRAAAAARETLAEFVTKNYALEHGARKTVSFMNALTEGGGL